MEKIYLIGDVHGSAKPFKKLSHITNHEPATVICLGDFGANYFLDIKDTKFKKKLGYYNLTYFAIRGNHEERPSLCAKRHPADWHTEIFWGNTVYVENDFPYIKYALDCPAKYQIPAPDGVLDTLVLPGAYSVDKYWRLAGHGMWFEHEQLTKEEMDAGTSLAESQDWNLVLSHTCPFLFMPTDLFISGINQTLVDNTMEHWLGHIEYNIQYETWFWGHFHALRIYSFINNRTQFMLNDEYVYDLYEEAIITL